MTGRGCGSDAFLLEGVNEWDTSWMVAGFCDGLHVFAQGMRLLCGTWMEAIIPIEAVTCKSGNAWLSRVSGHCSSKLDSLAVGVSCKGHVLKNSSSEFLVNNNSTGLEAYSVSSTPSLYTRQSAHSVCIKEHFQPSCVPRPPLENPFNKTRIGRTRTEP